MRSNLFRPSESNEGRRTIRFIKGDGRDYLFGQSPKAGGEEPLWTTPLGLDSFA